MSPPDRTPRPDDAGVEAWAALLHAHATVTPRIEEELQRAVGLRLTWYDVLLELRRASEGRLHLQDLAGRVVLSRSRVSRVVDELVAAGLVEKVPDPADGRATFARLTAAGRRTQRRAAPVYLRAIDEHFSARLAPTQRTAVRDALRDFRPDP